MQVFEYRFIREKVADFPAEMATTDEAVVGVFREQMRGSETESLWAMAFDSMYNVIGIFHVANGTKDSVDAIPTDIFRFAVRLNAAKLAIAHYHTVPDSTPSDNDIALTEKLVLGSHLLDIEFLDHYVITDNDYVSIRDYMNKKIKKTLGTVIDRLIAHEMAKEKPVNDKPA